MNKNSPCRAALALCLVLSALALSACDRRTPPEVPPPSRNDSPAIPTPGPTTPSVPASAASM